MKNIITFKVIEFGLMFVFFALIVGLVMIQANPLTTPLGRDNGFFLYAGSQVLKGNTPYIDFWDSKGPGVFYVNALGLFIGKGTRWGVWFLEFLFLFISSILFYLSSQKKWGHSAALIANIAWLFGMSRVFEGGNFTEEYSLLFSFCLLAYFIFVNGKPVNKLLILLGLVVAVNFLFRANNIGVPASILISLLIPLIFSAQYQKVFRSLVVAGIVASGVILIVCLYFFSKGAFMELLEGAFFYNFFYSKAQNTYRILLIENINRIGWPAWLAVCGYLSLLYEIFQKRSKIFFSPIRLFLLLNFPMEVILSSLSGRNYNHYLISWMPAIAILSANSFQRYAKVVFSNKFLDFLEGRVRSLTFVLLITLSVYIFSGTFEEYIKTASRIIFNRHLGVELQDPVANFIAKQTTRDDTVLSWGAIPSLNFLAKRDSPTPYLFYPAYVKSPYTEKMGRRFLSMLESKPPEIIVDTFRASPDYILSLDPAIRDKQVRRKNKNVILNTPYQFEFFEFVEKNYRYIETIEGFDVYRFVSN